VGIFPTKILLASDGSDETDLATRKAVDLANGTGSELHLVYVGLLPNFLMKDLDTLGFDRAKVPLSRRTIQIRNSSSRTSSRMRPAGRW
jgi:nucleotide-binding universal stress UspA family protein